MLRDNPFLDAFLFFICKVHLKKTSVENPIGCWKLFGPIFLFATRIAQFQGCILACRQVSSLFKTYLLQKSFGSSDDASVLIWPYFDSATIGCPRRSAPRYFPWSFSSCFHCWTEVGVFAFCCGQQSPSSATFSRWKNMLMLDLAREMMLEMQSEDSSRAFLGLHPWKLIWQWKFPKLSRCVSYWKWWFFSLSC